MDMTWLGSGITPKIFCPCDQLYWFTFGADETDTYILGGVCRQNCNNFNPFEQLFKVMKFVCSVVIVCENFPDGGFFFAAKLNLESETESTVATKTITPYRQPSTYHTTMPTLPVHNTTWCRVHYCPASTSISFTFFVNNLNFAEEVSWTHLFYLGIHFLLLFNSFEWLYNIYSAPQTD